MLADWRTAPIEEPLRATLGFLRKLTLTPDEVGPDDADAVRRAGVSDLALREAIYVCALFNMIDRVADALGFEVLSDGEFAVGARALLARGYRYPGVR